MQQQVPAGQQHADGRRAHSEVRGQGYRAQLAASTTQPLNVSLPQAPPAAHPADSDPEEVPPGPGPRRGLVAFDREGMISKVTAGNPFRNRTCPDVELPVRPTFPRKQAMAQQLKAVQRYIGSLQYNFLSHTFFNTNKHRPLVRIMDTCRDIVKECLPIRCLEATFLSIYLTQELAEVDRIPVSFKTEFGGTVYRHIVLLTRHTSRWGALGLSRKEDLMYKPLTYNSLADILLNFKQAYERYGHTVLSLKVGLPVCHDSTNTNTPCWKFFAINVCTTPWAEVEKIAENYSTMATKLAAEWETCAAISKRSHKRLQADGPQHCTLPPIAAEIAHTSATRSSSETEATAASAPSGTKPIAEQPLHPIPRTRSIITTHLAAAVATAAALVPPQEESDRDECATGNVVCILDATVDRPPSLMLDDTLDMLSEGREGSASSQSGSFSRQMSNSMPCRALRAIAALVDTIDMHTATGCAACGGQQTPSEAVFLEAGTAEASIPLQPSVSNIQLAATPEKPVSVTTTSPVVYEEDLSDLYDADTLASEAECAQEMQEDAEAAVQLANMQQLVGELQRQRPPHHGSPPPVAPVAALHLPPSTGPSTPNTATQKPPQSDPDADFHFELRFSMELNASEEEEEAVASGMSNSPTVTSQGVAGTDDKSSPMPISSPSAKQRRSPTSDNVPAAEPHDNSFPSQPEASAALCIPGTALQAPAIGEATTPQSPSRSDPFGPVLSTPIPSSPSHPEAKVSAPVPLPSRPTQSAAECQADELSEDEEENRMVLACILMNRSPLRKRFFSGPKGHKNPTITTAAIVTSSAALINAHAIHPINRVPNVPIRPGRLPAVQPPIPRARSLLPLRKITDVPKPAMGAGRRSQRRTEVVAAG
eukprot:GGOE01046455.1.p1 GENE.GGOE01046455.1~~GGOE01046455.1.p1  ORF type:complete len:880 (+),score=198.09 GGOE01046455.1:141-2780(+)